MDWGCLPGVGVWLGGGALDEKGDLCPGLWSLGIPRFHSCLVGPVGTISQLNPLAPPEDTRANTEWTWLTVALGEKRRPTSFCHWTELLEGRDYA